MECYRCKKELPDDSVFCSKCGARQTNLRMHKFRNRVCPVCGLVAMPEDEYCDECGHIFREKIEYIPKSAEKTTQTSADTNKSDGEKKDSVEEVSSSMEGEDHSFMDLFREEKRMFFALGFFLLLILLGAILMMRNDPSRKKNQNVITSEKADTEETVFEVIEKPSEEQIRKADYNLAVTRDVSLFGEIDVEDGEYYFKPFRAINVYNGGEILVLGANKIRFRYKNAKVTKEQIEAFEKNSFVKIDGKLSIIEKQVCIFPNQAAIAQRDGLVTDSSGNDRTTVSATKTPVQEKTQTGSSDYILPESASRVLTSADIQSLTAKQLNYAKNEIYARHGRKFLSPELQNYFNSKSWYKGTIDGDDFSESVFNEAEKENVSILRDREYSLQPGGYVLDQN